MLLKHGMDLHLWCMCTGTCVYSCVSLSCWGFSLCFSAHRKPEAVLALGCFRAGACTPGSLNPFQCNLVLERELPIPGHLPPV